MKNTTLKNTIVLFGVTLVLALMLGYVYGITKEPIALAEENARKEALMTAYPEAASFNEEEFMSEDEADAFFSDAGFGTGRVTSFWTALDESGNEIGHAMHLSGKGYGGTFALAIGVTDDGEITGLEVVNHTETAGLGAKCDTDEFKSQFAGIRADEIAFSKTGKSADNEIDAISGATVTTTGVTEAVNAALYYLNNRTGGGAQ